MRRIITIITAILLSCTGIFAAAKSLSPENRHLILASWFSKGNDFMMGYENRIEILGKPHGIYYCGFKGLLLYGGTTGTAAKITDTKKRDFYSLAPLEALSGIKVFTNKGSTWDTWGSRKNPDINRLNPAFIQWVFSSMVPDPKQRIGRHSCHEIYQKVFSRFTRLLVDSYLHLEKNNLFSKMQHSYEADMKKPRFEALRWLHEQFGHTLRAYRKTDGDASSFSADMAFGFWIRRSIDGTRHLIYEGLSDIMIRYDYHWFTQRKTQ